MKRRDAAGLRDPLGIVNMKNQRVTVAVPGGAPVVALRILRHPSPDSLALRLFELGNPVLIRPAAVVELNAEDHVAVLVARRRDSITLEELDLTVPERQREAVAVEKNRAQNEPLHAAERMAAGVVAGFRGGRPFMPSFANLHVKRAVAGLRAQGEAATNHVIDAPV